MLPKIMEFPLNFYDLFSKIIRKVEFVGLIHANKLSIDRSPTYEIFSILNDILVEY